MRTSVVTKATQCFRAVAKVNPTEHGLGRQMAHSRRGRGAEAARSSVLSKNKDASQTTKRSRLEKIFCKRSRNRYSSSKWTFTVPASGQDNRQSCASMATVFS